MTDPANKGAQAIPNPLPLPVKRPHKQDDFDIAVDEADDMELPAVPGDEFPNQE